MPNSAFNPDQQNKDLASKTVAALERISQVYRLLLWDHAKELGLSPIQIQLLIFVGHHQAALCNVSYLAKEFNVTKPTISDAVRVLFQKGKIEKTYSETDRRAYTISLSSAGEEIVAQTAGFAEPVQEIISKYDAGSQAQLFTFLSEIIQQLQQAQILTTQRHCYACRFYQKNTAGAYCTLLDQKLQAEEIRLDCPEFAAAGGAEMVKW